MKKNEKGFTLIELLAVIVILAIIALIAVPVILNIIDKANKSAFKDTAYGVISAGELYFAEQQLELNGMASNKTFTLPSSELDIKGTVPTGTILRVNTEGKTALAMSNGRHCITKGYEDTDITVTEDVEHCYIPYTLKALATTSVALGIDNIEGCVENGQVCDIDEDGTAFAIKVNDTDTYKFYVISDDGDKITLIMDRNFGSKVAWDTSSVNSKGPLTALNYLNNETRNWKNIPIITNYEYKNNPDATGTTQGSGYQKLNITNGVGVLTGEDGTAANLTGTMRARLLTDEETQALGTTTTDDFGVTSVILPEWLFKNLSNGCWLLTSRFTNNTVASVLSNMFGVWGINKTSIWSSDSYSVRPVIELYK